MAFRADEAVLSGFERVKSYLIPREFSVSERKESEEALEEIVHEYGPAVDGYPTWHPLVTNHSDRYPVTTPSERCGYEGLDHTRFFAHGFITCPYVSGQSVIDSVQKFRPHPDATIKAERLSVKFYNTNTDPILVRCDWHSPLDENHLVPKRLAVPLMMEKELPCRRWADVAERWENMRPYFLGAPHGNRSSLFVSQETALAMKKVFVAMTESGMFGPLMMD